MAGYPKYKEVSQQFVDAVIGLIRTYNKDVAMRIISLLLCRLQEIKDEFK